MTPREERIRTRCFVSFEAELEVEGGSLCPLDLARDLYTAAIVLKVSWLTGQKLLNFEINLDI